MMTTSNEISNRIEAKNEQSKKRDTPGTRYVAEFLPGDMDKSDTSWVAEAVDTGSISVCPRCQFLHLPRLPFPAGMYQTDGPEPVDGCDVCASLPAACEHPMSANVGQALDQAVYDLSDERRSRAEALYTLWTGAYNAADALLMSRLAQERDALRIFSRTPASADGEQKVEAQKE